MAQEPEHQPQRDDALDPQYPYGAMQPLTGQGTPTPQLSYLSPEFYEQNSTPVKQQEESQSGYTVPTPGPYVPPPAQFPYSSTTGTVPSSQQAYGAGSNYGHGAAKESYNGYRYGEPEKLLPAPAAPLPLAKAIRQLPGQYWRAITHPSSQTFTLEMSKAGWAIVWIQIVFYTIVITALSLLSNVLLPPRSLTSTDTSSLTPATVAVLQRFIGFLNVFSSYGQVLLIPFSLFVGTGILFLLARAFGGVGRFVQQLYCTLLFIVPLSIILNIILLFLNLIPTVGSLLTLLIVTCNLGYEGTLLGLMLMPVHRLRGTRAAGSVLLLFGTGLLLACVLGFILAVVLTASAQS